MTGLSNIQRLDAMFPGVLTLTAAQAAQALGWDRKRLYNLAPHMTDVIKRVGDVYVIPKLALARWLDELDGISPAQPQAAPAPAAPAAPAEPPKRKRGRPRKSAATVGFQQALLFEFERHAYEEAIEACKAIRLPQDDAAGAKALNDLLYLPGQLQAFRERDEFESLIPDAARKPKTVF